MVHMLITPRAWLASTDLRSRLTCTAAALGAVGALSACDGSITREPLTTEDWLASFYNWAQDENVLNKASSLMLTLAQVNSTILAFIFGLGLVTFQLAARFAVPRLRLRRRNTVFLLAYAVLGVVVPLLWSLQPSAEAAAVLTFVSFAFIVATPVSVANAAKAGSPIELAQMALREAQKRRISVRKKSGRLSDAHETFVSIRNEAKGDGIREEVQGHLLGLLLIALNAGHGNEAARIAASAIGEVDDGAERRLQQFGIWYAHYGATLSASPPASRSSWAAIEKICLRAGEERIELAAQATRLAATLAAGRVRAISRSTQYCLQPEDMFECVVKISAPRNLDGDAPGEKVDGVLRDVQALTSLLAERVPSTRRGRQWFDAICALLTDPLARIHVDECHLLELPFESANKLHDQLSEGLPNDNAEGAEALHRMKALCEVTLSLLETAQAAGCLHGSAGRNILSGYLQWIDIAAERRNFRDVDVMIGALRLRVKKHFAADRHSSTAAAKISSIQVQRAVAKQLAVTVAKLQHRHSGADAWQVDSYHPLDLLSWGHEKDTAVVARRFLPLLEEEAWSRRVKEGADLQKDVPHFFHTRGLNVLSSWLSPTQRPDVLLSVLLSRWQRALSEDYRRRPIFEQRGFGKEAQRSDDSDRSEEVRDKRFLEHEVQSLRVLQMARELLSASTSMPGWGTGSASRTLSGWCEAAKTWLKETEGAGESDIDKLLSRLKTHTETRHTARDFSQPVEIAGSGSSTNDVWQTVFGFMTPNDMMVRRKNQYERADFPPRTYCLIPEWDGDYSAFVVAVEEDGSQRLLVLEDKNGSCDEKTPLSIRYLPEMLLQDSLGDLLNCTSCFGLAEGLAGSGLSCPNCKNTGRHSFHELLIVTTHRFILAQPAIASPPPNPVKAFRGALSEHSGFGVRKFTSHDLRRCLADALEDLADDCDRNNTQPEI